MSSPFASSADRSPLPQSAAPASLDVEAASGARGGTRVMRLRGEIDLSTRGRLRDELSTAVTAVGDGTTQLVVDLRRVTFVDCGGVDVIARTVRLAQDRGVRLRLLPGPALEDLVGLLGLRTEVVAGPDVAEVEPQPAHEARTPPGGSRGASEYEHLAPLFAERSRLPEDHPRQPALRAALITGYLPVARNIARKHRHRGENLEDLEQVATLGLIGAVDRFDADRGVDFLAFAVPTITGEVQRHYRDRSSTIRVPRRIRQLQASVLHAVDELSSGGHAPRPSDLARHLDLDPADVLDALEANQRAHTSSLDEQFPGDDAAAGNPRYADALSTDDSALEMVEVRESLGPLLDALPDRERRIVLLRFFGNLTQSQIAARFGISQMHVSRLLSATLARLRAGLGGSGADGS